MESTNISSLPTQSISVAARPTLEEKMPDKPSRNTRFFFVKVVSKVFRMIFCCFPHHESSSESIVQSSNEQKEPVRLWFPKSSLISLLKKVFKNEEDKNKEDKDISFSTFKNKVFFVFSYVSPSMKISILNESLRIAKKHIHLNKQDFFSECLPKEVLVFLIKQIESEDLDYARIPFFWEAKEFLNRWKTEELRGVLMNNTDLNTLDDYSKRYNMSCPVLWAIISEPRQDAEHHKEKFFTQNETLKSILRQSAKKLTVDSVKQCLYLAVKDNNFFAAELLQEIVKYMSPENRAQLNLTSYLVLAVAQFSENLIRPLIKMGASAIQTISVSIGGEEGSRTEPLSASGLIDVLKLKATKKQNEFLERFDKILGLVSQKDAKDDIGFVIKYAIGNTTDTQLARDEGSGRLFSDGELVHLSESLDIEEIPEGFSDSILSFIIKSKKADLILRLLDKHLLLGNVNSLGKEILRYRIDQVLDPSKDGVDLAKNKKWKKIKLKIYEMSQKFYDAFECPQLISRIQAVCPIQPSKKPFYLWDRVQSEYKRNGMNWQKVKKKIQKTKDTKGVTEWVYLREESYELNQLFFADLPNMISMLNKSG